MTAPTNRVLEEDQRVSPKIGFQKTRRNIFFSALHDHTAANSHPLLDSEKQVARDQVARYRVVC